MKRNSLKFLHLSDLHLGRSFFGGKLKLPFEKAERRAREHSDILIRVIETAHNEHVDLILIAGDFWEEEGLSTDTVAFVLNVLGEAEIPIIIAPGNHDYYSHASHYSNEILKATIGREWSKNVFIFREYEFSHFQPPGLDGVVITGLAYHSNQSVEVRKLKDPVKPPEANIHHPPLVPPYSAGGDIHLAVIHGSRDDYLPPGKERTMPFSDRELLDQPFDYTALGHYHSTSRITDKSGKIRAAYPGSPLALTAAETGVHGCFAGVVHKGGVDPNDLVFIELDDRSIHRLKVDVSGLQHIRAIETKLSDCLAKNDVRDQDMALIELTGTYPEGNRIDINPEFLSESCFHLKVETTSVRPEWDIDDIEDQPSTTAGIFISRIKKMIDEATERSDIEEANKLTNALYYGLDALHSKSITPRITG